MSFKKFLNRMQSVSPAVSISKSGGVMRFNRPAVILYNLDQYRYCWLYWDAEEGRIGFEFSNEMANGACKVKSYRYTFGVAAYSFLNHFGVKADCNTMLPVHVWKEEPPNCFLYILV